MDDFVLASLSTALIVFSLALVFSWFK
uniref:Uncharacterized protein n=1 Tax=Rhizophora mucronata TaxID=61149 RepID=A0A2P2Q6Z4_RHIMU